MRFPPGNSTRLVALVAFDDVQILDVSGPASVFGAANDLLGRPAYEPRVVSARGGIIRAGCGVGIASEPAAGLAETDLALLLVAGGGEKGLRAAIADRDLRRLLPLLAGRAARYGSVCSGAFILAACGLLDGRRVATHWAGSRDLARLHPSLHVDQEALFVEDGPVWTSAGVQTGIDMALALVERDEGTNLAAAIARRLVLYMRRPGSQSQFSALLDAGKAGADFADLIAWMSGRLDENLDVPSLARRAGLSERSFHRKFTGAMGQTPARFVETLRLDAARALLAQAVPVKQVAARVGMGSAARLSLAFARRFGVTPSLFAGMHGGGARVDSDRMDSSDRLEPALGLKGVNAL